MVSSEQTVNWDDVHFCPDEILFIHQHGYTLLSLLDIFDGDLELAKKFIERSMSCRDEDAYCRHSEYDEN